jgi:soluble lytic murein transglycosylase-like protein
LSWLLRKLSRWWQWVVLLAIPIAVPICVLNVTVAWLGQSTVFPLSPYFLGYKIQALGAYAKHRPRCVFIDDEPLSTPLLVSAEQRHNLPCGLLTAIVHVESGGQPHRISSAGAMGPLQLIPPTARSLGVSDPFDPVESVDGAARYLRMQFVKFHSIRLTAAAYNAGPGAIVGRRVPQNGQTEIYVRRVMRVLAAERHQRCVPARRSATASKAPASKAPASKAPASKAPRERRQTAYEGPDPQQP